jgi:hypothetical protein
MPVSCECFVLSGRGLRIRLITRTKLSFNECGVSEYDRETLTKRKPWPNRDCCLSYPVFIEHAPYNIIICGLSGCTILFHTIL